MVFANALASLPRRLPARHLVWLACLALGPFARAEMPAYLRAALNHFRTDVPDGWAYTLTTRRDDQEFVEQFDPTQPVGSQWTLVSLFGRAPTDDERRKYAQSRPTANAGGPQANFQKGDIEPGSLRLVREDDEHAEFDGTFRAESSGPDKMLGHLTLQLVVHKRGAYVERYRLRLRDSYSPVLFVKMNQLEVEGTFAAPTADGPSLPATLSSHFAGRILFFAKAEKLHVIYSDFRDVRTELSR